MSGYGSGMTRRDVLVGAASGLALAAIDPGETSAQEATVSGIVFEDRDGTGVASASNPGLSGVLVSNGRDVTVTGVDGRYTLPLPDEATIFVVKPAGFMPPVDPATNLPRFYRHHQPAGSPAALNLDLRGPGADRASARLGGFPAETPGGAEGVRRRLVDRPAARDGSRSRLHPRGPDRGTGGDARPVRPHGGRHHVRRSFALPASQRDRRHDRAAVVERRGQPRPQFRSAGPQIQPRDLQALFRPELLRVFLRRRALPHARQRRLSRLRPGEAARRRQV